MDLGGGRVGGIERDLIEDLEGRGGGREWMEGGEMWGKGVGMGGKGVKMGRKGG